MTELMDLPTLHVEGDDDLNSLIHLLSRHGISFDEKQRHVNLQSQKNDDGVLKAMPVAIRANTNRAVGFVLDIDRPVADRWQQVKGILEPLDLIVPKQAPADGFIGDSDTYKVRVGVWLMPDNVTDNKKLEDFLMTLVPAGDALIEHAKQATDRAVELKAKFVPNDKIKAVLHSWLAWQEEPGKPYGTAIKAKYFTVESAAALKFVDWFRKLYQL